MPLVQRILQNLSKARFEFTGTGGIIIGGMAEVEFARPGQVRVPCFVVGDVADVPCEAGYLESFVYSKKSVYFTVLRAGVYRVFTDTELFGNNYPCQTAPCSNNLPVPSLPPNDEGMVVATCQVIPGIRPLPTDTPAQACFTTTTANARLAEIQAKIAALPVPSLPPNSSGLRKVKC